MNTQEILELLEKYYEGNTSDGEERILREALLSEEAHEGLEAEKEIFRLYSESSNFPEPSAGFEHKIIKSLNENVRQSNLKISRRLLYTLTSSAAAILLIAGSYFMFIRNNEPADTFEDPALAYAETMRILYQVSSQLNHGMEALEPVRKVTSAASESIRTINESAGLLGENLRSVDYFQSTLNMVYSPLDAALGKK